MKNVLVLSENKIFKKDLTTLLTKDLSPDKKINYVTVSTRPNAIAELSQKEFHSIIIDCTLNKTDLQLVLKYLSTNEYYFCHIFFLSEDFSIFQEVLNHINFPHIHLVSLPIELPELANKIILGIYPQDTSTVDQTMKINLEFLKVFIDSSKKVFNEFCNLNKINHTKPYIKNPANNIAYSVIGNIPLKSEIFEGTFSIGFTKETYITLIKRVLLIETEEINEEVLDFAAELVNMIYGQAKFILNDLGYNFLKVIPTFNLNPTFQVSNNHVIVVPIETEIGLIYIEVLVVRIKGFNV